VKKVTTLRAEPVTAVVEKLRDALERAENGEIRGVVIVANTLTGTQNGYAGEWDSGRVMWAVEVWKHRILQEDYDR